MPGWLNVRKAINKSIISIGKKEKNHIILIDTEFDKINSNDETWQTRNKGEFLSLIKNICKTTTKS
jgi:hypothetical protein